MSKNKRNNFPFFDGIKKLKDEFKNMVDEMSDSDFISMVAFLMESSNAFEEEYSLDEDWEDESETFYNQINKNNRNLNLFDDEDLPF